jgi:anti-anti-sigma regulatory factor
MRSDALDIILEGRGDATWLILSGPFHKEQIPNIRGKFAYLLDDGNRYFIVDLERVTAIDDAVAQMFLTILNDIRGKGGELKLVFKNELVSNVFAPYQNILLIFPNATLLTAGGFFGRLARRSKVWSKKTGVRISRQLALFLLIILCGWFFTLLFIIHLQNRRITEQQKELMELTQWKQRSSIELTALKERIRPLEQLGILRDSVKE